jgi:hypothetical protein
MDKVTSSDGFHIAFDRLGDGPPIIVVCGAMCDRALMRPTAEELAKYFTVFNYDLDFCQSCSDQQKLQRHGPVLKPPSVTHV